MVQVMSKSLGFETSKQFYVGIVDELVVCKTQLAHNTTMSSYNTKKGLVHAYDCGLQINKDCTWYMLARWGF